MIINGIQKMGLVAAMAASSHVFAACPAGTTAAASLEGKETCVLSGVYKTDLALTADKMWVLSGGVYIGADNKDSATIAIEPGTKIVGQGGSDFLVINRGSKIMANGTKAKPIVFTALQSSGRARGMWGGVVVLGNAPINLCSSGSAVCQAQVEGITDPNSVYGGNDPLENSGVLKYVRIEFAGFEIAPDNELNGLTLAGVGSGTTVEYIQIHMNADDGLEMFGGTVNVKYVVLTGNDDDSLDWQLGWTGKAQHVLAVQYDDGGNHGIEADNLKSPQDAQPRSNPEISNLSFIGSVAAPSGGDGAHLRLGTAARIYNSIFTGFKKSCFNIEDQSTFAYGGQGTGVNVDATGLVMENSIIYCPASAAEIAVKADDLWDSVAWFKSQVGNKLVDPMLNGYIPAATSPALGAGETPFDLFFDDVDYIGAVKDAASDWTAGWTTDARS